MKIRWILPSVLMRCWDSGDAPLAHTMLSTWELLRLSLSPPDREPTVGWWDSVLDLTQGIHLIYFIQFLVANSNSSFYWRWSLTHSVTQSRHTSKVERYRGSGRFSKDERFLSAQWAVGGAIDINNQNNDYERPQRPFKND